MRLILLVALVVALLLFLVIDLGERAVEPSPAVKTSRQWGAVAPPYVVDGAATTSSTTPRARTAPIVRAASASAPVVFGHDGIVGLIHRVFDRFGIHVGDEAVKVFGCETGGTYNPQATNGAHAGLAQLSRRWQEGRARKLGFVWDQMFQAEPNLVVAADLFAEQGWSPWTCRRVL